MSRPPSSRMVRAPASRRTRVWRPMTACSRRPWRSTRLLRVDSAICFQPHCASTKAHRSLPRGRRTTQRLMASCASSSEVRRPVTRASAGRPRHRPDGWSAPMHRVNPNCATACAEPTAARTARPRRLWKPARSRLRAARWSNTSSVGLWASTSRACSKPCGIGLRVTSPWWSGETSLSSTRACTRLGMTRFTRSASTATISGAATRTSGTGNLRWTAPCNQPHSSRIACRMGRRTRVSASCPPDGSKTARRWSPRVRNVFCARARAHWQTRAGSTPRDQASKPAPI